MLLCQRGFGCRILNLGNSKSHSFELVRGKQEVYISGQSAKGNYLPQNSNIHVLPLGCCTTQMLCLVLEIKL